MSIGYPLQHHTRDLTILLTSVICSSVIIGSGVYFWQESRLHSLEQSLQEDLSELKTQAERLQLKTQELNQVINSYTTGTQIKDLSEDPEDSSTSQIIPSDWIVYQSDIYGFSFSYPPNLEITMDEIHMEYPNHPKGFNWHRILLEDTSTQNGLSMGFEIDPDGYGPFFPDKSYTLSESSNGEIIIDSITRPENSPYQNEERFSILASLEAQNEHRYFWSFSFDRDGEDYGPLFQTILSTYTFTQ